MNVLLGLCLFFGITLAYDVNAGICFIGDHSCTQGKIISLYTEQKECTYVDKNACEKYNRNSYCKIDNKDKCYKPSECKVGYYKHTDDICSIGSYSHLIDIDNFGCGLPITNGGRDCGAVGYGAIYDEFGFSKQTLVFNIDSEKIDCYAAISQENCQKASPHGVCEQDKCGNWHVTKCAEGYGFYWRNESGCELGVDFNAEEGDAVCQKCLGCEYASLEECEEDKGNEHSACEVDETDGCVKPMGCKKGFVSVDDNSEICRIGTYMKLFDIDNNGCGVPGTEGSGGSSPYFEAIQEGATGLPGFKILPIARGNYTDDYSIIDSLNDWFHIVPEEEGSFDTQQNCEITTERGTRKCKADACGRWIWIGAVCNEGYIYGGTCPDGFKRADQNYDGTGCWKCECIYKDKTDCETDNSHSVCEMVDGCYKPWGCKPEARRCETEECMSKADPNKCYECNYKSYDECKTKYFHSECIQRGEKCYEPWGCEPGYRRCETEDCMSKTDMDPNKCYECRYKSYDECKTKYFHSKCIQRGERCYEPWGCEPGYRRCETEGCMNKTDMDPNKCYECSIKSIDECNEKYFNSKCIYRGEQCYEVWGCNDNAIKINEAEQYCGKEKVPVFKSEADARSCVIVECVGRSV